MTANEVTGTRDLKYSLWHRVQSGHLSNRCKALNIDFLEIRNGRPVAFFEIQETKLDLNTFPLRFKWYHAKILSSLTRLTKIPSYIVIHKADLQYFKVFYDLPSDKSIVICAADYAVWLEDIDTLDFKELFVV